mmetsp:Transcript_40065/g.80846  ORF Transcript_40065/g.80846 Transcript_40065/m.80846 type:complete len:150 (+) Transcript_40065:57-506(+)
MVLGQAEVEACREAFNAFDVNKSGEIEAHELTLILQGLGRSPREDEIFELMSIVDTNMSGTIDFAEFLQVIDYQKNNAGKDDGSMEIIHAFTACGGNPDKTGIVKCERVIHVVKEIFKLHFDIETLMKSMDEDEEGHINFEQFRSIFVN